MARLTIKNDYTNSQITIDPDRELTREKIRRWRRSLLANCSLCDDLGGRGPQDDPEAYQELLERAQQVLMSSWESM